MSRLPTGKPDEGRRNKQGTTSSKKTCNRDKLNESETDSSQTIIIDEGNFEYRPEMNHYIPLEIRKNIIGTLGIEYLMI